MVIIAQDFIPVGRRNRPAYKMDPRYITIHDTANPNAGANAKAHVSYLKGAAAAAIPSSWHFTVDDKEIYQHLPLTENGWHCGDGTNGTGNRQSIGVEVCENKDGNRAQAEANAAWLTAKLIKDHGLGVAAVKQHYDWSGKNCPRVLRGRAGGWQDFLAQAQGFLGSSPGTPIAGPAQATVTQAQEWARAKGAAAGFIAVALLYWQEAPKCGIDPAVAYAQSAKETGFGRFGGVIPGPEWHNWCGMKTSTGGSNSDPKAHMKFSDDRTGVIAHIDHLALYAGVPGYPKADTPDPRHFPSIMGTAKTVEALGGKWAGASDYGTSIVKSYLAPLLATADHGGQDPEPVEPDLVEPKKEDRLMVISFDDFNDSDYKLAYPALKALGVCGTSYAHTGPMTAQAWAHAREMVTDGWDIQCHTVTHPMLTQLPDAVIRAELEGANAAFVNNGLPRPKHHAYPSGDYDSRVIGIVKEYRKTGRSTRADTFDGINRDTLNWYELHPIGADIKTEEEWAYLKERLDQAYRNNRIVITIHHHTHAAGDPNPPVLSTRVDLLKRMVEHALGLGFRIVTISQLYSILTDEKPEPVVPVIPSGPLPKIIKRIGIEFNGKMSAEPGYLIDNATYVRAAYIVPMVGGEVTGHGDHIKVKIK